MTDIEAAESKIRELLQRANSGRSLDSAETLKLITDLTNAGLELVSASQRAMDAWGSMSHALVGTKKIEKKKESGGAAVWEAYSVAFFGRYGVKPVRNAKVNAQCAEIAKRLGYEDAQIVAAFYLTISDAQYARLNHPIGLLVMNCESIHASWKMGKATTGTEARKIEQRGANVSASQNYLNRKHQR